jgi:hypothetical protein
MKTTYDEMRDSDNCLYTWIPREGKAGEKNGRIVPNDDEVKDLFRELFGEKARILNDQSNFKEQLELMSKSCLICNSCCVTFFLLSYMFKSDFCGNHQRIST